MENEIQNKVQLSGLVNIDLDNFLPKEEVVVFDIKPYLWQELVLKEKDFRQALKEINWSIFQNKVVAVCCSAYAIIPNWAYMLLTSHLKTVTEHIYFGSKEDVTELFLIDQFKTMDKEQLKDARVVIKGCGSFDVSPKAYTVITNTLIPLVKSLMFGEPCSTVPIYKRK